MTTKKRATVSRMQRTSGTSGALFAEVVPVKRSETVRNEENYRNIAARNEEKQAKKRKSCKTEH